MARCPFPSLTGVILLCAASWAAAQGGGVDAEGDPVPAGARARLGSTRFRMGGNVSAAALSLDGKWLVSSNNGDILVLADPATGKEIRRLRLPGGYGASFLSFSPDGKNVAVMGYAPFLQIVEVPSGRLVAKMQAPQANNNRLVNFAFSGDGTVLAAGTDNFGQNKNYVHAWDVASGKPLGTFEVIQNSQIRAALSRDGSLLATSGYYSARNGIENNPEQGRTVQLWDLKTGRELRKLKIERNQVMAIALSPDGTRCAVASGSATFHLFATGSGTELRRFAGRRGPTQILQFAPDGKTLVAGSADGTVQLWEAASGTRLGLSEGPRNRLFSLAFPAPGQVWALGMAGQALSLWNAATGQQLSPTDGHMASVRFLAYADDGKTLLSGGTDGKLCWWDTRSTRALRHLLVHDDESWRYGGFPAGARVSNFALSRDGKFLAAASDFSNTLRLYELASGKVLCDFDAPRTSGPSGFAFSPDNTRLAALGQKGVHLWDVTSGVELPTLAFRKDSAANGGITSGSLVFSPDGKILAGARSYYERNTGTPIGEVYLWNAEQGTEITCVDRSGYSNGTMAFSPNSQVLALPLQSQSVLLVKAATGRELGRLEGSQANFLQALAFSPDGRLLAGAQQDTVYLATLNFGGTVAPASHRIVVWELAAGQVRQEFTGHQGAVACLAFAPDGRTLASGSTDTTVLLWDTSGQRNDGAMTTAHPDTVWNDLAAQDSKHVYQHLMTCMISSPAATLEVLRKNLKPAQGTQASSQEIERLIGALDHERFILRVKAAAALEHLGELAGPALRKAQLVQTSLEAQRRLKVLVERLDRATLPPDAIRQVRAVEVLEKIGSGAACALLETLALGAPHERLTLEARAALERLRNR